jgi:hypothetical protein
VGLSESDLPTQMAKVVDRLLVDHPTKLAKFEMFMLSMNRELRDEAKGSKAA